MAIISSGSAMVSFMGIFMAWSVCFFCLRVFAKWQKKSWTADDWLLLAALVASIVFQGLVYEAQHKGFGSIQKDTATVEAEQVEKLMYASQLFYLVSLGLGRLSAAYLVRHLAQFQDCSWQAHTVLCLTGIWTVASLLVIALRAPLHHPWSLLDGTYPMFLRWTMVEVSGLVVELCLWAIPFQLVWHLHTRMYNKVFLLSVFSLRLLLIAIISFRLHLLTLMTPSGSSSLGEDAVTPIIVMAGGLLFSIVASSMTVLKVCLSAFSHDMEPRPETRKMRQEMGLFGDKLYSGADLVVLWKHSSV